MANSRSSRLDSYLYPINDTALVNGRLRSYSRVRPYESIYTSFRAHRPNRSHSNSRDCPFRDSTNGILSSGDINRFSEDLPKRYKRSRRTLSSKPKAGKIIIKSKNDTDKVSSGISKTSDDSKRPSDDVIDERSSKHNNYDQLQTTRHIRIHKRKQRELDQVQPIVADAKSTASNVNAANSKKILKRGRDAIRLTRFVLTQDQLE